MSHAAVLRVRLDALRVELVDLAYALERRGRLDAADLALAVAGRVGEFHDDLSPAPARSRRGNLRRRRGRSVSG